MLRSETVAHLALKRLAVAWAQEHGFRIVAAEVSLPHLRMRIDVAACRAAKGARRPGAAPPIDATAIFECKQGRGDFLRDSRCAELIRRRLAALHEQRKLYEESMRVHLPSLHHGEALFPEFDGFAYAAAGFAPYDRITGEIAQLSARLHQQTKFANLLRWRAAHLHYVVAEAGVAQLHELPSGWGLLVANDNQLEIASPAIWQEIPTPNAFQLLIRIAMSGTRAMNRELEVNPEVGGWANRKPSARSRCADSAVANGRRPEVA